MKLSIRERILITLFAVVVILYAGIRFLVVPAYNGLSVQNVKLQQIRLNYIKAADDLKNVSNYDAALNSVRKSAEKASAAYFSSLDSDLLNVWVDKITTKCGLKVSNVQISDPKVSPVKSVRQSKTSLNYPIKQDADNILGSAAVPSQGKSGASTLVVLSQVTLKMTGGYSNFTAFLDEIKNCGKTASVSSFIIERNDRNVIEYTATVDCYAVKKLDDSDATLNWAQSRPSGQSSLIK